MKKNNTSQAAFVFKNSADIRMENIQTHGFKTSIDADNIANLQITDFAAYQNDDKSRLEGLELALVLALQQIEEIKNEKTTQEKEKKHEILVNFLSNTFAQVVGTVITKGAGF